MDKHNPTIGIFMPAYNQGQYIHEALNSLKEQTYQNFLVHIVDDGSTDKKTSKILSTIKYDKAKIFPNKDNKGVVFRAAQHYKMFNTDYVLVLCADDILDPTFLEKTVNYMEKNPKCGAVSVNLKIFNKDKNNPYHETKYDKTKFCFPYMLCKCQCLGSSLMRKKALDSINLSGNFTKYQDWDRFVSMLEEGWTLDLIEEPLFNYRQVSSSLSHSMEPTVEYETSAEMIRKHKKIYEKYYSQVIPEIIKEKYEILSGKNWLEQQYFTLSKEINRLNGVIEELKNNKQTAITKPSLVRRIKNKIKRIFKLA